MHAYLSRSLVDTLTIHDDTRTAISLPLRLMVTLLFQALKDTIEKIQDSFTCQCCADNPINTVFIPCGHLVCCSECANRVTNCPLCRTDIKHSQLIFLPTLPVLCRPALSESQRNVSSSSQVSASHQLPTEHRLPTKHQLPTEHYVSGQQQTVVAES